MHRFAQPHRYSERVSQAVCDVECHDVPPVNVRLRGGLPHTPFCTTPPPCTHTHHRRPIAAAAAVRNVAPIHQRAIVPPFSFHSSVAADALPLVVFLPACVAWFFSFAAPVGVPLHELHPKFYPSHDRTLCPSSVCLSHARSAEHPRSLWPPRARNRDGALVTARVIRCF